MQATMHGAKVGNSALQVAALSSVIVISRAFLSLSTPQHREKKKKNRNNIVHSGKRKKKLADPDTHRRKSNNTAPKATISTVIYICIMH